MSGIDLGTLTMALTGDRLTFSYRARSIPGTGARPGLKLEYDMRSRRVVGLEMSASRSQSNPLTMTSTTGTWRVPVTVFPRDMGQTLGAQIQRADPNRQGQFSYPLADFCAVVNRSSPPLSFARYIALFEGAQRSAAADPTNPGTAAALAQFLPLSAEMYRAAAARCSVPGAFF